MSIFDQPPRDLVDFYKRSATLGTDQRYREATLAETWYISRQYDGLLNWDANAALSKKKPREIVPLYKTIIDSLRRFVWGGERFPRLTVNSTVDDDGNDNDIGPRVDDVQAKVLETFAQALIKAARLDRCAKEYSTNALITTSAAVIVTCRGGHLTYYVEHGKHCTPKWSAANPRELDNLEILYQYEQQVPNGNMGTRPVMYWFRRIIDTDQDIVFQPVEVRAGSTPEWVIDATKSVKHGLGFCPVKWIRTMPLSADAIDGQPVIDPALYPLLSRVNYIYSQASRSVEYSLDPQWIRKNVDKGSREELQKNPGKIWDIEDADKERKADIAVVETTGAGPGMARDHLADIRSRILEACSVVLSDPDKMSSKALSGVVLEYMHAPMISLASDLRKDLGDEGFCDVVNLAMRICAKQTQDGYDVYIPGVKKATDVMIKAQLLGTWLDFPLELHWSRYFSPGAQDIQFAVTAANQAKQGGLVSKGAATRFVAEYFSITDVAAESDTIDDEKQQAMQDAQDSAIALAKATPATDDDDSGPPVKTPPPSMKPPKKVKAKTSAAKA
jgi:Phage portal protein, SPP1 Gp6-like